MLIFKSFYGQFDNVNLHCLLVLQNGYMPLIRRTNNRVGPANDRVVDVARQAISNVLDVQARRYENAFQVHGFNGILYRTKERGLTCACCSSEKQAASGLSPDGKAERGTLNSLLLDSNFGVRPYGTRRAPPSELAADLGLEGVDLSREFIHDQHPSLDRITGSYQDHYGRSDKDPKVKTLVSKGEGPNGPTSTGDDDLDNIIDDLSADTVNTTLACPICFGTGFVGGYDVYLGHRAVFSSASADLKVVGSLDFSGEVPFFAAREFRVENLLLPRNVSGVDSFRVWNYDEVVPATFTLDGNPISHESEIMPYCDGNSNHILVARFSASNTKFTHFEIQFNQSENWPLFEFPKVTKNANQNLLENFDPFTINLSPRIPQIASKDVITESTYGKALLVGQVTPWNTRSRDVLGWDAEVRVVQPMEMFNLLPRRMRIASQRTPAKVRDNSSGRFRT